MASDPPRVARGSISSNWKDSPATIIVVGNGPIQPPWDPILGSNRHDRECRDQFCTEYHWSCSHDDHCREDAICEHGQLEPEDWDFYINPLHGHTDNITDGKFYYAVRSTLDGSAGTHHLVLIGRRWT